LILKSELLKVFRSCAYSLDTTHVDKIGRVRLFVAYAFPKQEYMTPLGAYRVFSSPSCRIIRLMVLSEGSG
jgi:hypothetical protein